MEVDIFDFSLPEELIALNPVYPKDSSKLLEVTTDGLLKDRIFNELPLLIDEKDIIVFNNTKVIPARILGLRNKAEFDVTLFKEHSDGVWQCLIKKSRRLKVGDIIKFTTSVEAFVISKSEDGFVFLGFNALGTDFFNFLEECGKMPLPPYIRKGKSTKEDNTSYQTVYAKNKGAVAAPTAGLHFTADLLKAIKAKKVEITLHVGGGTFLPVKVSNTDDHKMHAEYGEISPDVAQAINSAKKAGGRVIAVGTTSLRLLEASSNEVCEVTPFKGETDIFITPGYKFKVVDALVTNFHLPKSTLIMLVSAFSGLSNIMDAYNHAIENKYRFYSYGDATFLYKK